MNCVLAAADAKGWMDILGPAFLVFFFFLLPIIRAVKEARDKQKEGNAKRDSLDSTAGSATVEVDKRREVDDARKAWEDLLRGDAPTSVAPQKVPPIPAPQPPIVLAREVQPALSAPISSLPAVESEAEMERSFDEEKTARDENEAARRIEFERREQFLRREREGAAAPRTNVEPGTITTFDFGGDETGQARADAARRRDLLGMAGNRRAALQRAFVASEVLGRPVALRTGSEELGPLALRQ